MSKLNFILFFYIAESLFAFEMPYFAHFAFLFRFLLVYFIFAGAAPINLGLISNVLSPSSDPFECYQCEGLKTRKRKRESS